MAFIETFKVATSGFVLVLAYTCFILDIIMIRKVEQGENTYPPAVVSLMVAAICQMLFMLLYFVRSKSKLMSARNMLVATLFFACWTFASVVATAALRHHHGYCGPASTIPSDCAGVLRGTMGIGFALFGFDLLYLAAIAAIVRTSAASFAEPLGKIDGRRYDDEAGVGEKQAGGGH